MVRDKRKLKWPHFIKNLFIRIYLKREELKPHSPLKYASEILESTSETEINCCLSVTHFRNPIYNLHLCQYLQVKRRMRRDAQLDSDTDEDEDDDGTNLCSAFEINQHLGYYFIQYYRYIDQ